MTKLQSLLLLVQSMTLSEKKAFRIKSMRKNIEPDYLVLYNKIEKNRGQTTAFIRNDFLGERPGVSFETTVKYLYELLLESMLELRTEQDSFYFLFNKILKARILYEKSLFDECFELLNYVIGHAEKYENYNALLLASRLELEYLLALNFPNIDEETLLKKQFLINEILKYLRKINEQSSLYETLKHRIIHKGHARSQKQKDELNDLVYSEISIVASLNLDNFEISKLHQLFQSNYLISVGDYKSALNSYIELNNLFEANKHLWSSPPVYYLHTLEGVLESLRGIHNYEGMAYFIRQLKAIDSQSAGFRINLTAITFLYELFPFLDRGDFASSVSLMNDYREILFDKLFSLNRARQAELCLYTSLVYFGIAEYNKAHKFLNQIILRGKNYYHLPLYRTIRLVNLIILYMLKDFDLIKYEIRSMKRDFNFTAKDYKIEYFLFGFLMKEIPSVPLKRQILLDKTLKEFNEIRKDVFERQIITIFDFTAWVESMIRKVPLAEVLSKRIDLTPFSPSPV
jgi:hypothetical protein